MYKDTIFFKATDGVDLEGILYKNGEKNKKILISIHGMATNCIKIRDEKIAENLKDLNIDMLVFNNRGHDLVNYINKKIDGNNQKTISGTSYEEISECYNDILGAINYTILKEYEEIYTLCILFYNTIKYS